MTESSVARYLFVSDIHSGSNTGLMQDRVKVPEFLTGDSHIVKPSRGQRWLLKRWRAMIQAAGKLDGLILNGDLCDGVQRKIEGRDAWTTDLDVQVENAVALINMIKAPRKIVVNGSGYHTGEQRPLDRVVAEKIGGEWYPDFILQCKKHPKVRMHIAHYISGTKATWQYATTPIARDMVIVKLNDDIKKYGKIGVVVRAHQHWLAGAFYSRSKGFVMPGFQLRTPFAVKTGRLTPPDIGWVIVEVEDSKHVWVHPDAESPEDYIAEVEM